MREERRYTPISLFGNIIAGAFVSIALLLTITASIWISDINSLRDEWTLHERGVARKSVFHNMLRGSLGYEGLIHNLKNYLLRGDTHFLIGAQAAVIETRIAISGYRTIGVSAEEASQLDVIEATVEQYQKSIRIAEKLKLDGVSPRLIDQQIRIDDAPTLAALNRLNASLAELRRKNVASITHQHQKIVDEISTYALIIGALLLITIIGLIWVLRTRVIKPLSKMAAGFDKVNPAHGTQGRIAVRKNNWYDEFDQVIGAGNRFLDAVDYELAVRLRAEEMSRKNEKYLKAIIENSADAIITIDDRGLIETFNPAAERIFGYTAAAMTGKNVSILVPTDERKHHDAYVFNSTLIGPRIINKARELYGRRKSGEQFPMELTVSPMKLEHQLKFIGIMHDVTERKKMEKVKDEFISTVSHELRTPLTAILGSLGLVHSGVMGELEPKVEDMIGVAMQNTKRLNLLVNDLLDLEKLQSGDIALNYSEINIDGFIENALKTLKPYADERDVKLIAGEIPSGVSFSGDKDRLNQVLSNLLSNAAKFSPQGEAVEVSASVSDARLFVRVKDKGPGISDEFHASLFERFTQADSSDTRQKGGTGLGLSISKTIVEMHNGQIGFETKVGEGSTFYFDLPIAI